MMESTIAVAVASNVGSGFIADWQGRGGPHLTRAFVTEIDDFSRRVSNGIVGPRRELILMTVERPGVARARFGNEESKRRICNHIDPRRGSPQTFPRTVTYSRPISANPPRPLKKSRAGWGSGTST